MSTYGFKKLISYFIAGLIAFPCASSAALISVSTQDIGLDTREQADLCNSNTSELSATCISGPQTQTNGVGDPIGTGFARASVDGVRGELRVFTLSQLNDGGVNATATAQFSETYQVSGSGVLQAFLDVEGNTTLFSDGVFGDSWQVGASIFGNSTATPIDSFSISNQDSPLQGAYQETLNIGRDVRDGDSITLFFSLFAQISGGTDGLIDFGNTARAFVTATPGVVLSPTDPGFLSSPTFGSNVNSVPEPAPFALLLAGIFAFRATRRRTIAG